MGKWEEIVSVTDTSIRREIPLTSGYKAIVDAEDYDFLMQWNWYARAARGHVYATRSKHVQLEPGKRKQVAIQMHQMLMPPPVGFVVDHINGNSLDNRKSNLRICKQKQNVWNRKSVKGSASKYKGVDWYAASGSWRAYIKIDGKQKHLGCYKNEDDAARAYNKAAIEYHGEYARLNPVEGEAAPRLIHPTQHAWHQRKQEANV